MRTLLALTALILVVGCTMDPEEPGRTLAQADGKAKWTDGKGVSHWHHTVRFVSNVYIDTSYTKVIGKRWHCLDDSATFDLPEPPYEVARASSWGNRSDYGYYFNR